MTQSSQQSLTKFILSEMLDMAAALGTIREAQRSLMERQTALERRLDTWETKTLPTSSSQSSTATKQPMDTHRRLTLLLTGAKFLVWLAPRLLVFGALALGWAQMAWKWVLGHMSLFF